MMSSLLLLLAVSAEARVLGEHGLNFKNHGHHDGILGNHARKQANYNESVAKSNLYFAYGAYCPEAELEDWNCKWCNKHKDFELYSVIETGYFEWHLQAFTGYDPSGDQIVVAFRGSHNVLNWFDDFEVWQQEYPGVPGAYIHEGFYQAWNDLASKGITNAYRALLAKYPGKKTLSTGYFAK